MIDLINSDSASIEALQDEIKLLNEKLDYLNDGNRRLHGLYDKSMKRAKNIQNDLNSCEKQHLATKSKNHVCEATLVGIVKMYFPT